MIAKIRFQRVNCNVVYPKTNLLMIILNQKINILQHNNSIFDHGPPVQPPGCHTVCLSPLSTVNLCDEQTKITVQCPLKCGDLFLSVQDIPQKMCTFLCEECTSPCVQRAIPQVNMNNIKKRTFFTRIDKSSFIPDPDIKRLHQTSQFRELT